MQDLDSIEHLDEDDVKNFDDIDSVSMQLNKKRNQKKIKNQDDDKVINCLYYSLMCCECSIS